MLQTQSRSACQIQNFRRTLFKRRDRRKRWKTSQDFHLRKESRPWIQHTNSSCVISGLARCYQRITNNNQRYQRGTRSKHHGLGGFKGPKREMSPQREKTKNGKNKWCQRSWFTQITSVKAAAAKLIKSSMFSVQYAADAAAPAVCKYNNRLGWLVNWWPSVACLLDAAITKLFIYKKASAWQRLLPPITIIIITVPARRNLTPMTSFAVSACRSRNRQLTAHQYFTSALLQVWWQRQNKPKQSSGHSQALISPLGEKPAP